MEQHAVAGRRSFAERRQDELVKRLNKEISPFTLTDLPLSGDEALFPGVFLFQKVLGAGSFGVVVAAVERAHLEQCAVKVLVCTHAWTDSFERPRGRGGHPQDQS